MKRLAVAIFSVLVVLFCFTGPDAAQRGISVTSRSGDSLYLYKDYHALVVGIGDYTNGWPDLPGAVKDAEDVAASLERMGVSVRLVLDPTSRGLRSALNKMAYHTGREKNRALIFYFAGHGETLELADGTKLGYIIPADCPLKRADPMGFDERALSMKDIELLALKVRSKHVLMMFDSCFSGSLFNLVRAAPVDISEKSARPVRQFITAGAAGEQVPDRSVFKLVFLDGVRGEADLNKDGFVTGSELGMHLQEKVVNYSRGGQHPQYGKINNPKLDKGDFIFALSKGAFSRPGAAPPPPDDDLRRREEELKRMEDLLRRQDEMLRRQREMEEKLRRKEEELKKKEVALKKPKYYTHALPPPPTNYIELFGARVTKLQFFESGYNHPPKNQRVYKTAFSSSQTRYINWELNLSFSPPGRRIEYAIHAKYIRVADGTVYATQVHDNAYVQADWTSSWHAKGWGNKSGGTWPAGSYRVDLYVNGVKVASGSFKVI